MPSKGARSVSWTSAAVRPGAERTSSRVAVSTRATETGVAVRTAEPEPSRAASGARCTAAAGSGQRREDEGRQQERGGKDGRVIAHRVSGGGGVPAPAQRCRRASASW